MKHPFVRLGAIAAIEKDVVHPSAISDGTTYVGLENVTSDGRFVDVREVESGELASAKLRFDERHVLFGKLRPYLAKIARPDFTGICSTDILPILPGPELDKDYLFHFLRQPNVVALAASRTSGANLPRLSPKTLAEFQVPLAPLSEQQRIANVLDQAAALREQRRVALSHLETLKQSIFFEMFGDPIENPHNYKIKPMLELVDPDRPITYGILKPGEHVEGGVPYVRVLDMQQGKIVPEGVRKTTPEIATSYKRSTLMGGDVLLSIRGHVGRLAVVPAELAGANITQDTARLALVGLSPTYVIECLRTPALQRWMARHTKGAAVRGINLGDVKKMPIPLPPQSQQEIFSKKAELVDLMLERNAAGRFQSDDLFVSLQSEAFTGAL